ncbi:MAG: alanine--tRNA ligase [Bacteroidales bacterium]|nr:alanine--tRNA ligase [Bacteroidales bacterium]
MMTSKEIRQQFLDFFASKNHTVVPSAPMVVKGDPTLMFTNAGMNQFKDIFLGNAKSKFYRATDSQKCLRVSGKHNDLEEVGHDTYHHTMFEMLGNWSFGDYFKNEAIDWAWELLTEVYKIDRNLLYATIFEGSDECPMDMEAKQAWLRHLPEDHIVLGNKHDNFWEMGETGPCGPCSEIHIDIRTAEEKASGIAGRDLVNQSDPHVIEIWNLVFMQFERKADGHLETLPAKHIDTGMGFERLCAVLQGKNSNYDSDVFTGMLAKIGEISGHRYGESKEADVAMRVIADHIRAISFSIADGQLPSNVKAGYVIRRILRRAVRYGFTFLDLKEPFLCRLVPQLISDMGEAYPELPAQQKLIENVIREEEMAFLRTLDRGIRFLSDYMAAHRDDAEKKVSGVDAFTLYDTFGFPIDLTQLIASENGYSIDMDGFNVELQKQKDRARNATANEFGDWEEFYPGEVEFKGYDKLEFTDVRLLRCRTVVSKGKTLYQLVFNYTPFYPEKGGQVGDTGYIISEEGERIAILNTVEENKLIIHIAERIPRNCRSAFSLHVDRERRLAITNNHTATHLLDQALREILGKHVEQKGSFVGPDYFRFDFSHFAKVTEEELEKVEDRVNELIRANNAREENRHASMEEAKAMGAIALFGEKYGDRVRVIKFGDSVELCGGCHADATGQIGLFKIVGESAVAAGIRRIEAVSGIAAINRVKDTESSVKQIRGLLNNAPNIISALSKLIEDNNAYKKQAEEDEKKRAKMLTDSIISGAETINGIKVAKYTDTKRNPVLVRSIATNVQKTAENTAFLAAFEFEGKPQLIIAYSNDLVKAGHNAGADIREAAKFIQGGGGGQPGMATAGGRDCAGLGKALEYLVSKL